MKHIFPRVSPLLLLLSFLLPNETFGQCNPGGWQISADCDQIQASGGLAPGSPVIFCEGETVIFNNTSSSSLGITKCYIDWGDGKCEMVSGNPPQFTHAYDVPDDSCVTVAVTTHTISFAVEKSCGAMKSFHYITTPIAVKYKPVAKLLGTAIICKGDNANFVNDCKTPTGTYYKWEVDGVVIEEGNDKRNFSYKFSNFGSFTVKLTVSNTCGSSSAQITVTVRDLATAAVAPFPDTICLPNAVLQLMSNNTNALGQTWTVTGPGTVTFINGTKNTDANPHIQFPTAGKYTLTMQVSGCGSPMWTGMVVVGTGTTVSLKDIPDACSDPYVFDPNDFVSSAAASVTAQSVWTFGGGTPPSFTGANPPQVSFSGSGKKFVKVFTPGTCGNGTAVDSFQILPPATAVAALNDTDICGPDELVTVTDNTSANATGFTWSVSPALWGTFANGTSSTSAKPAFRFEYEGAFTVTLTVKGCGNPVWSQTVQVRLRPVLSAATAVPDACSAITVKPASAVNIGGGTADVVNWTFVGGTPATFIGAMPPDVVFADTGTHRIICIASNPCGADTQIVQFKIFPKPVLILSTPHDTVCNGDAPFLLQTNVPGGLWSGPGVDPVSGQFTPSQVQASAFNQWNLYIYEWKITGCEARDTVRIFVKGQKVDPGPNVARCANKGEFDLSPVTLGGLWSGLAGVAPGGHVFTDSIALNVPHTLTYSVVKDGCPNAAQITLTINGPPTAALGALKHVCIGTEIDFGLYTGGSSGLSNCQWDFGDSQTSNLCAPKHAYTAPGFFDIVFIGGDANGCSDTATAKVQVIAPPNAKLATDKTEGCAELTVLATNQSNLIDFTTYIWHFGDGTVDSAFSPAPHIYQNPDRDTTFFVRLDVANECGTASDALSVTVHPYPIVIFAPNPPHGCTPLLVAFNNITKGNPQSFEWFINGQFVTDNEQLPPQKFLTTDRDSVYRITLAAHNVCGDDTLHQQVTVHPNPVKAFISVDTLIGCAPFTVRAANVSTQGIFASWNFGDQNTAPGDSVAHTYTEAGVYLLTLFVNNGCGYDTAHIQITVLPMPKKVQFSAPPYVCAGSAVQFQNESDGVAATRWDFGDGNRDSTHYSPSHVFLKPGTYIVLLTGYADVTGCPAVFSKTIEVRPLPVPMLGIPKKAACAPFLMLPQNQGAGSGATFVWDFGDGVAAVGDAPPHTYESAGNYVVMVKMTDAWGCRADTSIFPVTAYPLPVPDFSVVQTPKCATPTSVLFQNTSQHADEFRWVFAANWATDSISPVLLLGKGGPLRVRLWEKNQFGCMDSIDRTVTVYARPHTEFWVLNQKICSRNTVLLDNASDEVNLFRWDFGDGSPIDTNRVPLHRFDSAGVFNITLYASRDSVCFDSAKAQVTVLASPVAAFTFMEVADTSVVPNGIVRFLDQSQYALRWRWYFGDGDSSVLRNPVHRYDQNGERTVTLIVYNDLGCPDTVRTVLVPSVFGQLYVPNTFSPERGGEGAQFFRVVGSGLKKIQVEVHSVTGQLLWSSDELDGKGQPSGIWDGKYGEEVCPPGVYFWKVSAEFVSGNSWKGMVYRPGDAPVTSGKLLLVR